MALGRGRMKVWVKWRNFRRRETPRRVVKRWVVEDVPRRLPQASQK